MFKGEYFGEYLVNTLVNTFLRGMNTLDTVRVKNYFLFKKRDIDRLLFTRICLSVWRKSIHRIHQQIQSIHVCIHQVFTKAYIFERFK